MRKCLAALILATSLTACGSHTAHGNRYWNERNDEMPNGIETICGDPSKAVNVVEWGKWTDSCL